MDYTALIMGLFFFIIGIALRYWINRRKFNRRNASGLEGFSNYERATATRFLERIGKLIAYVCIAVGLLFLLMFWQDKKRLDKEAQKNIEMQKPQK
ncbi:molybdenum ABC transporter permease [Chryseobacterium tructae]|uniref:Molybdenum ABC transporter permease n=1 Tax=Chryseobacterium tructae TaxID=1037380 RepID=A0ABV7XYB2_9FLAO|nr:molybdenum ABC transporter permease [Chryseobacterium tructae]MDN3693741.1 molybdenum ABC transporter permease [Chryseobacterium tructae]